MVKTNQNANGLFYWLRVTSYNPGATIQVDGGRVLVIDCLDSQVAPPGNPWNSIAVTGTVNVELGETADEPFPGTVLG